MSRLVIVSNRMSPIKKRGSGAEGGLAVAVYAALRDHGGVWFGWSGQISEREPLEAEAFEVGNITYASIDLTQRDFDEYYNGYANRTLWPLFHYRLDLADFTRRNLMGYLRVNQLLASRLTPLLQKDDMVWIHDYHLIPMAEQLRSAGCKQAMGFFLHIPWPAMEVVLALPNHMEIVRSLSAYDVVGFQTDRDLRAFLDYVEQEAHGRVGREGTVSAFGRRFKAKAFPIGIDTDNVAAAAEEAASARQTQRLKTSLIGRDLIIGVDRLDYSKGLVSRMEAFERLLNHYPANRGAVTLLQIAPPSRTDVPEYVEIRRELEAAAGRINGAYAEFDWNPIRYLNKGFTRQTLTGFFRLAHMGMVTPLRDGMNLVAKEFVAAQDPENPGVLVLSRFAGAARELEGALIVNPFDIEGVAEAMQVALTLSLEERLERWQAMFDHISRHDIHAWREEFVDALSAARPHRR